MRRSVKILHSRQSTIARLAFAVLLIGLALVTVSNLGNNSGSQVTALTQQLRAHGGGASTSISVDSQYTNGANINGMYMELQQNGNDISTGYTALTFSVTGGQTYRY